MNAFPCPCRQSGYRSIAETTDYGRHLGRPLHPTRSAYAHNSCFSASRRLFGVSLHVTPSSVANNLRRAATILSTMLFQQLYARTMCLRHDVPQFHRNFLIGPQSCELGIIVCGGSAALVHDSHQRLLYSVPEAVPEAACTAMRCVLSGLSLVDITKK